MYSGREKLLVCYKGEQLVVPKIFHRKGSVGNWETDFALMIKLTIWRYTRYLLCGCGYSWHGYVGRNGAGNA